MAFLARFRKVRRRMRADAQKGSAAIEFAFVAPVFFVLLLGIFEAGIMFFAQSALQNAVTTLARQVRTGQAQNGGLSKADFAQQICNGIDELLSCANLQVDVQAYPAGFGGTPANPLDGNGEPAAGQNNYNTGGPCDVVVVRSFYRYSVLTPLVSPLLTGGKGYRYLLAAAAGRNEPYGANPC